MKKEEGWLLNEKYNGQETTSFHADCERLTAGEPLAYIIGSITFLNTKIFLDSHPLIPRTETEFWVEKIINEITNKGLTFVRVLDLCAGSGCIGVSVLKAIPTATVDFVEIDTNHHNTIRKNIRENGIDESRAQIVDGNLFEHVSGQYDYILTNPPYIDPNIDRAEASVKKYEPEIALYGGKDGTQLISTIIATAPQFLTEHGVLVIEHEPEQSESIRTKALSIGFDVLTYPDQFGVERYTTIHRKPVEVM